MRKEVYEGYFKNKKVTVMGLGLLGRGVGDTLFLAEAGAELVVTDKKTKEELISSLDTLISYPTIRYVLGEHRKEDFEARDFILKSAGVSYDSEYVLHARDHHVPVYMSAALVADIVMKHTEGVTIIGVTGTRGKSTVTHLIAHILRSSGARVHVGGNIRGVANLPLLKDIEDGDFLVLELDSWQLQGFGDMKISPHIAVFTSFLDDHMNYYHHDKERYFNDKANIYRNQHEYDVLIASSQAKEEILIRDRNTDILVPEQTHFEMMLLGEHNQVAGALAYETAIQCGLSEEEIRAAIKTFPPVEGRLENLGEFTKKHLRVFNDNNATTPDATIAALDALTETYHTKPILIIGGTDKGIPLSLLETAIQNKTKHVVYLSGTGTDRITLKKEYEYEDIRDCIDKAFDLSDDGDSILFSPGFASFSKFFHNEYERNDAFIGYLKTKKVTQK